MAKYIEAEAAKKELKKTFPDDWIKAYKTIDRVPAADVRENVHGENIRSDLMSRQAAIEALCEMSKRCQCKENVGDDSR